MSTNFEKQLFMPRGVLGPTTCLGDLETERRIVRWYRPEWEEFLKEVQAYKLRILEGYRTLQQRLADERRKCPHCQSTYMAMVKLRRYQRGMLSGFGVKRAGTMVGDCTFTESTIANLNEFNVEPTDSYTHGRLFSDGDWYSNASTGTSWGASEGTWQGGCAVADYDTRWNRSSGDTANSTLNSGTDGVWHAATTSAALGYTVTGTGALSGSFTLQCRDGTSLTLLFTDSFTMDCEVDARN